jgi:opacity protein-like surface antigen
MSRRSRAITFGTAVLLACASSASAQGLGNSRGYAKVFGGVTLPQDDSFGLTFSSSGDETSDGNLDYDAGAAFGAALGYLVAPNVGLEFEYAFRTADAVLSADGDGTGGQMKTNTYMVNAVYTFAPVGRSGALAPYVGAGLGAVDLTYEPDDIPRFGGNLEFAYQVMGGVGYRMNESWTLSGELRYVGSTGQTLSGSVGEFETSYRTFDALVGASYRF